MENKSIQMLFSIRRIWLSMMEGPDLRVDERDAVLAARRFHILVARRAAGLGYEGNSVLAGLIDVVPERDETV